MPSPLLTMTDLSVERGEHLLFDGFELSIEPGEIIQFAGPNGAGKTSLMRVIAGLLEPLTGSFHWQGSAVAHASQFSDEILYMGHKPAVRYQLSPLENLEWYAQLQYQQVQNRTAGDLQQALKYIGLEGYENEPCANLSAGQKKRVGLTRMSISSAPLWILDEPFTAVDRQGVETLVGWIENYVSQGGAVLYTTHQQVEFQQHQPRIIDLVSGY